MKKTKKKIEQEALFSIYEKLIKKGTPTNEGMIYLSDGLWIDKNGEVKDLGR
jgi:hypothetical protein